MAATNNRAPSNGSQGRHKTDVAALLNHPDFLKFKENIQKSVQKLSERLHLAETRCKTLEDQNKSLKEKVEKLEEKSSLKNREEVRNILRFSGVPEQEEDNEDTKETVAELIKAKMKLRVKTQDIDVVQRLGVQKTDQERPRTLQVKFNNTWTRRAVYQARVQLQNVEDRIYVNEILTKENSNIYFESRQMKKKKLIHSCWTWMGDVFVKKHKNSEAQMVEKMNQLAYFTGPRQQNSVPEIQSEMSNEMSISSASDTSDDSQIEARQRSEMSDSLTFSANSRTGHTTSS